MVESVSTALSLVLLQAPGMLFELGGWSGEDGPLGLLVARTNQHPAIGPVKILGQKFGISPQHSTAQHSHHLLPTTSSSEIKSIHSLFAAAIDCDNAFFRASPSRSNRPLPMSCLLHISRGSEDDLHRPSTDR